ncbi:hypothetical protein QFC21_004981 [Naganishia friedmannii]|uniref:Uncharacterized protein n=1 Tax=Naganishia friedmannii TaxID=89922 RepID=A0ACC2VDC9_9TREE|nr:hypothetical protein QFC21_004981 [Naganishia friedmannii]
MLFTAVAYDIPSLAVAAALVLKNPDFVAKMFYNDDGKANGGTWPVPGDAKLLPKDGQKCSESAMTDAANLREGVANKRYSIMVNFTGGYDESGPYGPGYTGTDLTAADGDSDRSAWIYLFQATMLNFAQQDVESLDPGRGQWSNTRDFGENKQGFDSDAKLQDCSKLGRMMYLATGRLATQESIKSCADNKKLEAILGSMSRSPVLVIPKATEGDDMRSDRIWIGTSQAKEEDMWTFWNPVDRESKSVSMSKLVVLAQDIVYLNDHESI